MHGGGNLLQVFEIGAIRLEQPCRIKFHITDGGTRRLKAERTPPVTFQTHRMFFALQTYKIQHISDITRTHNGIIIQVL